MKIFCLLKLFAKKRIGFISVCLSIFVSNIWFLSDNILGRLFLVGWAASNLWREFYTYRSRVELNTLQGLYLQATGHCIGQRRSFIHFTLAAFMARYYGSFQFNPQLGHIKRTGRLFEPKRPKRFQRYSNFQLSKKLEVSHQQLSYVVTI